MSIEAIANEEGDVLAQRGVTSSVTTITAIEEVPFESDVLPLLGATVFFAGGVWWKRRGQGNGVVSVGEGTTGTDKD